MNPEFAAEVDVALARARRLLPPPEPLDGQCLRDAVAACLRIDPETLPFRRENQDVFDWVREVERCQAVRLELTPADELPPEALEHWIAFVETADPEVTHAVAMIGRTPLLDIDRHYYDPTRGLVSGLRIFPAEP